LRQLLRTLADQLFGRPSIWSRPIGLLVLQEATGGVLSDASHGGLGGWRKQFAFLWRLLHKDLVDLGFHMRAVKQTNNKLQRISDNGLQINILEFVAIIINIWLVIHYEKQAGPIPGGHIIDVIANNTSALSWLRYAAQSHSIPVRNLAYFCHGLLLFSQTSDFLKIQGQHLAGKENMAADALSRPEIAPTIASAIAQFCQLKTCHACQLP
jgi:hypothetical protein